MAREGDLGFVHAECCLGFLEDGGHFEDWSELFCTDWEAVVEAVVLAWFEGPLYVSIVVAIPSCASGCSTESEVGLVLGHIRGVEFVLCPVPASLFACLAHMADIVSQTPVSGMTLIPRLLPIEVHGRRFAMLYIRLWRYL